MILSSPPPMNTCKIYLHKEKFSLKTNWKLTERLLYNQTIKEDPHGFGQEGYSGTQIIQASPWEGTQLRRGITQAQRSPWGVSGSSHILGTPAWDSMTGSCVLFVWFENQWYKQEFCKKDKTLGRLIKKQREKNQINKIRNENGEIITDNTEIQRIIRDLCC